MQVGLVSVLKTERKINWKYLQQIKANAVSNSLDFHSAFPVFPLR